MSFRLFQKQSPTDKIFDEIFEILLNAEYDLKIKISAIQNLLLNPTHLYVPMPSISNQEKKEIQNTIEHIHSLREILKNDSQSSAENQMAFREEFNQWKSQHHIGEYDGKSKQHTFDLYKTPAALKNLADQIEEKLRAVSLNKSQAPTPTRRS